MREESDGQVVIVTHGQAMSTWLATKGVLDDVVSFWSTLTFADAWQLTPGEGGAWLNLRRLEVGGQPGAGTT